MFCLGMTLSQWNYSLQDDIYSDICWNELSKSSIIKIGFLVSYDWLCFTCYSLRSICKKDRQETLITLWFWELCIDLSVCGRFQELRHFHQCLEHYPLVKQEEVSFQGRSLQAFLRSFSQLISPVEINVLL